MSLIKYIDRIHRIDKLIQLEATGNPGELARLMDLSVRSIYEYVKTMKVIKGPIKYSYIKQSYVYTKKCTLNLKYEIDDET